MKVLVTGAGGYIGSRLVQRLINANIHVNALFYSKISLSNELINDKRVTVFKGDIRDAAVVDLAVAGCSQVYHLAGYAKNWSRLKDTFYQVNVEGTNNVFHSALKHNVDKLVFTSTAGVFGPQLGEKLIDEGQRPRIREEQTEYERTKIQAEFVAFEYISKGLDVVIVNPTRVFGPGSLSESNAGTKLISKFVEGEWRIIPGDGTSLANYAYVDDVVEGHVLAMEKGMVGERYILGGENLTYNEFFQVLKKITGKDTFMFNMSEGLMFSLATGLAAYSRVMKTEPLITPPWIKKYLDNWGVSSDKAVNELGYNITPVEEALSKTIEWLKANESILMARND